MRSGGCLVAARPVCQDLHSKSSRQTGDAASDSAKPQQAQHAAAQIPSDIIATISPSALAHAAVADRNTTKQRDNQTYYDLTVGLVNNRAIGDNNPAPRCRGKV